MLFCVACRNDWLSAIVSVRKGGKNMFSENLKNLRKQKGLTQEELAERLHIVRQTVSKWEKGLSVPDAELLIRIAETFETSVSTLLGTTLETSGGSNIIAEKLEQLNAQLAVKNRRNRRIWKAVAITFISIAVITVFLIIFSLTVFQKYYKEGPTSVIEQNSQIKEEIKDNVIITSE